MPDRVKIILFSDLPIASKIRTAYEVLASKGILGKLNPRTTYADEPQFYYYVCEYFARKGTKTASYGFGSSDFEDAAITRAIAEAIEYYCISYPQDSLFIQGTYNKLKGGATDPIRFSPFSRSQLSKKRYKKFVVTRDSQLNWLEGYSLTKRKEVLIPASLVYANYNFSQYGEPTIRIPISTGAACGPTLDLALHHGLCEIIERDAYMISFLPGMKKKLITIDNNNDNLFALKRRIERYNFELFFLNTSIDTSVYSVVCLLIDRTGSGPAVCAGLGGSLDPETAIQTAAFEAVRRHISNRQKFFQPEAVPTPKKYSSDWFLTRKLQLWSAPHMIRQAEKIIEGAQKIKYSDDGKPQMSDGEKLNLLVNELDKLNYEVLYVDTTVPEAAEVGLHVVKIICPEMVPLWHDDRYPYLGIKRLYDVPKRFGYNLDMSFSTQDLINMHPF